MLDSDQEPSYNLSKNLLLLPRILKLIEDMVYDSNPLDKIQMESVANKKFSRALCGNCIYPSKNTFL